MAYVGASSAVRAQVAELPAEPSKAAAAAATGSLRLTASQHVDRYASECLAGEGPNVDLYNRVAAEWMARRWQDTQDRRSSREWRTAHAARIDARGASGVGIDQAWLLTLSVTDHTDAAAVVSQLSQWCRGGTPEVIWVRVEGFCSTAVLEAVQRHTGRTLRSLDVSSAAGFTAFALAHVLAMPQLHELSFSLGPRSWTDRYGDLSSAEEMYTVLSAATNSTLVHLQVLGDVPEGIQWHPTLHLPYLHSYAVYFTSHKPELLPPFWSGERLLTFESAAAYGEWNRTWGFEVVHALRPAMPPVRDATDPSQVIVPV